MQGRENENKEKIKNCVGGTDDPSGYKTSVNNKLQKNLFYQF